MEVDTDLRGTTSWPIGYDRCAGPGAHWVRVDERVWSFDIRVSRRLRKIVPVDLKWVRLGGSLTTARHSPSQDNSLVDSSPSCAQFNYFGFDTMASSYFASTTKIIPPPTHRQDILALGWSLRGEGFPM